MGALYLHAPKRFAQAVNRAEDIRPGRYRLSAEEIAKMDRLVKEQLGREQALDLAAIITLDGAISFVMVSAGQSLDKAAAESR